LLDAHVHIHPCFEIAQFLAATYRNFLSQPIAVERNSVVDAVVLLTESAGVNSFAEMQSGATSAGLQGWTISLTGEPMTLRAKGDGGEILTIISGRQIVSRERLEILALGLCEEIPDSLPIREVIDRVQSSGALCVLPWGFGKWTGRRGRLVRELIASEPGPNFFTGDNAGRLSAWPAPAEFDTAAEAGIGMLSGTDPLPWPDQVDAAGKFGTVLDFPIDADKPFASIRHYLLEEKGLTRPFGKLESLLPFVWHQVGMQFKKRAK
jgi:hypothetical protein